MKKIILLVVICVGAWSYYQEGLQHDQSIGMEKPKFGSKSAVITIQSDSLFQCDGRQYCSQMTSREEAEFFIRNCPNTKMDGDRDGIPCENDTRF